jgi:hypothetical protein
VWQDAMENGTRHAFMMSLKHRNPATPEKVNDLKETQPC